MIELSLAQIAEIVGGRLADIAADEAAATRVTGTVEFDSRAVTPGALFLALPGARSDGHDFAAAAVAAGAVAVLAARPVGVPAIVVDPTPDADGTAGVLEYDTDGSGAAVLAALAKLAAAVAAELVAGGLTIVGITGSSGKTSTKDLIAAVLAPLGEVIAPPGSFNNELGHPWTVLRATRTPTTWFWRCRRDIPATSPRWRRSRRRRSRWCSTSAPPTSVSSVRGRPLRDESRTAAGGSGVRSGDPQRRRSCGGGDGGQDRGARGPGRAVSPAPTYGRADVTLDELARARFTLHAAGVETDVALAVHGDHQVSNALCAAAVALECGASGEQVAAALAGAGPVSRHRMHVSTRDDGVTVINDAYNANPDSMRAGPEGAGLDGPSGHRAAPQLGGARRDGRARRRRDIRARPHRSAGGALRCHRLVVVGTGRSMSAMHHGAVMEGSWGGEATMVADADAALALLRAELREGDVVLVKASNAGGARRAGRGAGRRMRQILIAVGIALTVSILLTPVLIRLFTRQGFGHEIREDGPPSHHKKRGTPSMGGVAIVAGIWAGYLGTHLVGVVIDGKGPSASGLLVLGLATALGAVGFIDDLIKIRRSRNLGLNKTAKTVGMLSPPCSSACWPCSSATPTG